MRKPLTKRVLDASNAAKAKAGNGPEQFRPPHEKAVSEMFMTICLILDELNERIEALEKGEGS